MWTPKRILILLGGIFLFIAVFTVYSHFLGGFDGLPNLPEGWGPQAGIIPPPEEGGTQPPQSDLRLLEAFGADCEELRRPIRLFLRSKGLAVATKKFDIEPDGRVKLSPFSACVFPKGKQDNTYPEINTVKCDVALLMLDKPASNVSDLASRRIIGIELRARQSVPDQDKDRVPPGILITNNRRTPQKTDDIEVLITNAPLIYDDKLNRIMTDGFVQLLDIQTQPRPTQITAKGMEIQLSRDGTPNRGKPKPASKGKGEGINGVESLKLLSNVDMYLYVDPRSGFLADSQDFSGKNATRPMPASAPGEVPEKSKVVIRTEGPFHYDLVQELARFDSPPPRTNGSTPSNENVLVTRDHKLPGKKTEQDQLECDRLDLQFRRKAEKGPRTADSRTDKEIETALATSRSGRVVKLNMCTENLKAWGLELNYRCPSANSGPHTILKGQPMYAIKDGHKIEARELHLIGADKNGLGQQAIARGPGQIDLFDKAKTDDKGKYPLHAVWRDSLVSTKVREDGKLLDFLVLTGDASFIDEEHKQELNGQKLQVWLESAGPTPRPAPQAGPANESSLQVSRQKPHRLEAFDKVSAFGPDMIVRHANHLVVRFKEDATFDMPLPDKLPGNPVALPGQPAPAPLPDFPLPSPPPGGEIPIGTVQANKPAAAKPAEKIRKPIELTGDEITAYVNRAGSRNQLQELVAKRNVHVVQDGKSPKDTGIDIDGDELNLIHHPAGNLLYVFGDTRKPARLQLNELILSGPKVTINQKDNIAEVEGTGVMDMPSNTTLEGGKSTKPGSRLVVHWNKEMLFNGKYANFSGGVQAFQDNGWLKCKNLQVTFDREVSLKEGQKGEQAAKVEKLLCDGKVLVLEEIKDAKGKIISYRRGEFIELTVDNLGGPTNGAGPGLIRSWGKGGSDFGPPAPPPPNAPPGAKVDDMRITQVNFEGRMFSNTKDNTRTSKFYDNVEVCHFLASDPLAVINPNVVPKGGFQLRCELLSVYTKQINNKSSQLMWAERKVTFRNDEFFGRADVVKFDEASDHVIFEANQGNSVILTKNVAGAANNQVIRGSKILYKRQTGEFLLDGVRSMQWGN